MSTRACVEESKNYSEVHALAHGRENTSSRGNDPRRSSLGHRFGGSLPRFLLVAAQQEEEAGEDDGASEDGRESRLLREDQPRENRRDHGFCQDRSRDDRGFDVTQRPVEDGMP